MTKINKMPMSARELVEGLALILKPTSHTNEVKAMAKELRGEDIDVPEEVGLSLGLIDPVDQEQYVWIRERLNKAFYVGEYPDFDAPYNEDDTEFGDITDTFHIVFQQLFSKPFASDEEVSFDVRLKWRDVLLAELDEMVGR